MVVFGFNEAGALAGIITLCAWQMTRYPFRKSTMKWFETMMGLGMLKQLTFGIPVVYILETALLTITLFYFWQQTLADSWQFITGTVLLLIYVFLVKARYLSFWEMRSPRWTVGLGVVLLLLGGAIYAPLIAGSRSTPAVPPSGFVLVHRHLWWVPVMTHSIHFFGIFISVVMSWRFWSTYDRKLRRAMRDKRDGYREMDDNEPL